MAIWQSLQRDGVIVGVCLVCFGFSAENKVICGTVIIIFKT